MPEVPTIEESGLPLMAISLWGGFFAPAGTPAPVVERLSTELRTAMNHPDVRPRLEKLGLAVRGDTPQEFAAFLQQQAGAWRKAIEVAKIPIDG